MDSTVSLDNRVKLKVNENSDKYLHLAKELKKYETWKPWWYQL